MLISLTKNQDLELYKELLSLLELHYHEGLMEQAKKLKEKIDNYDYTEDDIKRKRLDSMLRRLSPGTH